MAGVDFYRTRTGSDGTCASGEPCLGERSGADWYSCGGITAFVAIGGRERELTDHGITVEEPIGFASGELPSPDAMRIYACKRVCQNPVAAALFAEVVRLAAPDQCVDDPQEVAGFDEAEQILNGSQIVDPQTSRGEVMLDYLTSSNARRGLDILPSKITAVGGELRLLADCVPIRDDA